MFQDFYVVIFRTQGGLKAILSSRRGFERNQKGGHSAVTEVELELKKLRFTVAYPKEWKKEQAHYLVETQIANWGCFNTGEPIPEVKGGVGGSVWFVEKTKPLFADDRAGGSYWRSRRKKGDVWY